MKQWLKILIFSLLVILLVLGGAFLFLAHEPKPERIQYGMSFNTLYARELGLDW